MKAEVRVASDKGVAHVFVGVEGSGPVARAAGLDGGEFFNAFPQSDEDVDPSIGFCFGKFDRITVLDEMVSDVC